MDTHTKEVHELEKAIDRATATYFKLPPGHPHERATNAKITRLENKLKRMQSQRRTHRRTF